MWENLRCDGLLVRIELSRSITLISTLANTVNLVVDRSTMMITILTSTSNSPLDVGRMPGTNTSDLSETLVCLSWKLLGSPSACNTGETVTLGDSDNINNLILLEDRVDANWLLEETVSEGNLVSNATSVDLNLHQMSLLLLKRSEADLGVGENTDNSAVLLDALELAGDGLAAALGVLLGVLGESLLLALVPVLVEAALDLVAQVLGPDGGERAQTAGSLNVADQADSDHLIPLLASFQSATVQIAYRRSLDDGDGLNDFLLVQLGSRTVEIADDGAHSSLVAHGGRKVDGLLRVILGEAGN